MSARLKYRLARPLERFEPYAFLAGWAASWVLPYFGLLTWVVVFAPDWILVPAWRFLWRSMPARVATARRTASGVELVSDNGTVEPIVHADVDALTTSYDKAGVATDLRLERRIGRALVFEVSGATVKDLAAAMGVDDAKARRRYALTSRVWPHGLTFVLIGFGAIAWSMFGMPTPEIATYLLLYQRAILMPLVVVLAIPTALDVGADGIGWRWLFWKGYHAFASITTIAPKPNGPLEKAVSFEVSTNDEQVTRFFVGNRGVGAISHLMQAFAESRESSEHGATDDWLPIGKNETTSNWIERLRAIGAHDGGYRSVSVSHLWTVVEDVRAPASTRCGAALVLGTNEAARTRLRVVATQVVDPAFSAVLEGIACEVPAPELERLVASVVASEGPVTRTTRDEAH